MRSLTCLILSLYMYSAYSQDTIFLNSEYGKIPKDSSYCFFKIVQASNIDTVERTYFKTGIIHSEIMYSNYFRGVKNGVCKVWFDNGDLKSEVNFKEGFPDGLAIMFWSNGNPKRIEIFRNGVCIKGDCFSPVGTEIPYFDFQSKPKFPGGDAALIKFIAENAKYPKDARKFGTQGTVYTRFIITSNGEIDQTEILHGINSLFNEEAMRVIKTMPKWIPAYSDGEPLSVQFIVPVNFVL